MSLGCGDDDSQDADELEDGAQKQAIAQQALQEGGLRDLWRGQVQVCRHDAAGWLFGELYFSAGTCANRATVGRKINNMSKKWSMGLLMGSQTKWRGVNYLLFSSIL